ncbi:MAG: PorV/PorQ family protein [Elusimicrobiales bacterium]|nr:PorV/PorQ family protein [Elusimicrobiales bacterium]
MRAGSLRVQFIGFILCLTAPAAAFASGPGTSAANFMKIPVGARETSLGGAFTAVADNADAVFYNPAGLGLLAVPEISYAYNNYLSGVSQQWVAAAYPAAFGTLGLGVNYLGVKAFESYDNSDRRTGSVSAYDLAAYLGWGDGLETNNKFLPSVRYGATVKFISEKLDSSEASGYGLDAGLLLLPAVKNLRFGLGAENLAASRLSFISGGARPAMKVKTGVSYRLGSALRPVAALVSLDLNFPQDGPRYLSAGIETTLYGALALRAGYSSFGDISNGVSFGLGLGLPSRGGRELRLDYSYGATYDLGSVHKFGLAYKFAAFSAAPPAGPPPAAAPVPARPAAQPAPEPVMKADSEFERQVAWLYSDSPDDSRAAAEYLAGLDSPLVLEHFIALLSSGKAWWKQAAVRGLALMKDGSSLKVLEGALTHEDQEVRRQAALAIGSRGEAGSAAALQNALKGEESDSVKSAIIEALGKLPVPAEE